MAKNERNEIESLIDDFETEHKDLYDRMEDDDNLYNNEDYDLDGESSVVTTNDPRAFADSVLQRVDSARIILSVTTPKQDHDKETKIEHLCYGILLQADKNLRRNTVTAGRTVKSALGHLAVRRGFICARVLLTKEDKKIVPIITPIDTRWFSYGLGSEGFEWCATKYWRDSDSIEAEYGEETDGYTPVIDYWNDKENIIIIGKKEIRNKHKLDRIPFVFLPVGTSPLFYSYNDKTNNLTSWGESAFARSRKLYDVERKVLSIWLNVAEKSHKPAGFLFSPNGQMKLERLPWGAAEVVTLPDTVKWQAIEPPDIANSIPALYNIIQQKIQKGDFSQVEYGLISGADYPSGKTLNVLNNGTAKVVTPILDTLSACYEDICEMITEQYKGQGVKTNLKGYDSKGRLYYDDIKPTDCDKPWDIEVKFESISSEEDMQNIAKAQMLKGMGKPDEYIDEQILKIQDPDAPKRQRLLEMAEAQNPIILTLHQMEAAQKEGKEKEAQYLAMRLKQMVEQMAQPQGVQMPSQPDQMAGPQQLPPPGADMMPPPEGAPSPAPPMGGMNG
jgi:hypothetical protein